MARRQTTTSKHRLSSCVGSRRGANLKRQTSASAVSMLQQMPSEHLDDETKLAKRHLNKEMWQLVSIAVKRMADELVSISNNQQAAARIPHQESLPIPKASPPPTVIAETNTSPMALSLLPAIPRPLSTGIGGGDMPSSREKATVIDEPMKRRTLPIHMLEPSVYSKKKAVSNNATRRSTKPRIQPKPSKKASKGMAQRLRSNAK